MLRGLLASTVVTSTRFAGPGAGKAGDAGSIFPLTKPLPRPLNFPREQVDMDTAITLMRSSYDVTDFLDICPMDDFQAQFYKKRLEYQSEYVSAFYNKETPNIRAGTVSIGDLSDPQYFDFISFVQYATINDQIQKNRKVFEEQQGVFGDEGDFVTKLVVRDPSLGDKETVLQEHGKRVGEMILDQFISEGLKVQTSFKSRPSIDELVPEVNRIMEFLSSKRFCAAFSVSSDDTQFSSLDPMKSPSDNSFKMRGERSITVNLERPINLWSQQALGSLGYTLKNNFEVKIIQAYLQRCGITDTRIDTTFNSVSVRHRLRLGATSAPSSELFS